MNWFTIVLILHTPLPRLVGVQRVGEKTAALQQTRNATATVIDASLRQGGDRTAAREVPDQVRDELHMVTPVFCAGEH